MPSYLRRFYINKLTAVIKKQNEEIEKVNKQASSTTSNIPSKFRR